MTLHHDATETTVTACSQMLRLKTGMLAEALGVDDATTWASAVHLMMFSSDAQFQGCSFFCFC